MARWLLTRLGRMKGVGTTLFGAQGHHHQHEGASNGVGSKENLKPKTDFRGFGGLANKKIRRFKLKKPSSYL